MKIKTLLVENNISTKQISRHQGIPYTTLCSTFERPVENWRVNVLRAVANELRIGVDELISLLDVSDPLSPFIKWVGGKRQLLRQITTLMPPNYNRYFEPFLGGGAVFLNQTPVHAVVNDFNSELTNVWKTVQDHPKELIEILRVHEQNNSKEYYLDLRSVDRDGRINQMTQIERAARFIYMNKTGFNGLWRVNKAGQNNVPYGRYKNPNICDDRILTVSEYLKTNDIQILNGDYRDAVETAGHDDFVYFDPPYVPVNPTSSFTAYTNDEFGLRQQQELRDTFVQLDKRGAFVMLSNSDVPLVEELYGKLENVYIHHVSARRNINSNGAKRGNVGEVLITNYQKE